MPFYSLGLRLALPPHELLFAAPSVFFFFFLIQGVQFYTSVENAGIFHNRRCFLPLK